MNTHDRFTRSDAGAKRVRKTLQLCRQIYLALSGALAALGEEALLDVSVESVEPAPDASRLLATLTLSKHASANVREIYDALERARGVLRAEVAAAITRKRAPELAFLIRLDEEVMP